MNVVAVFPGSMLLKLCLFRGILVALDGLYSSGYFGDFGVIDPRDRDLDLEGSYLPIDPS